MRPSDTYPAEHILITGGAGYIGSALTGVLLSQGYHVSVIDTLAHGGDSLLGFIGQPRFTFFRGDVSQPGVIKEGVQIAQMGGAPPLRTLVHLAGIVGFPACAAAGRERSFEQNVDAVKRAFEQSDQLNAERFIFSSTYSNYGVAPNGELVDESSDLSPQSIYAESKIAAEEYLLSARDAGCAPLIFRFATLFGTSPRTRFDLMVNQFVLEGYTKRKLLIYQREFSRSFIHIKDILDGILLGIEAQEDRIRGEIFNLGDESGNFTKDEIVDAIRGQLPDIEVTYKELFFDGDMRDIRVSFAKVRKVLGFKSKRALSDGVSEILHLLQSGLVEDPYHEKYWNARLGIEEPA